MQRHCPTCGSYDVRRSNARDSDDAARTLLRSRYRCRSCSDLFWVVSARAYRLASVLLALNLVVFAVVALLVVA